MANNVATRYQNALTYAPGRSVGFYPDAGWQGSGGNAQTQVFQPATFAPFNALAAPQTTAAQQAPGYGVDRLGAMAATFGIDQLGKYIGNAINAPNLTPSDPYTGSSGMAVDPNADYGGAVDTALGQAGMGAGSGFSGGALAVPGDAGMGVDAALGAVQMAPSAGWGEGASFLSQIGDGISGIGDGIAGAAGSINPLGMGAGMLGSWGGGMLARGLVEGDAEQQPLASSIGGALGGIAGGFGAGAATGAAMGSIIPGIGTLIGAFVGALAGGTLGGGSPDIPYSWGNSFLGHDGLTVGDAGAENHATPAYAQSLNNQITAAIQQRAAAEGLQFDPYYSGEGFNVGTYRNQLTYQPTGLGQQPAGANQYTWQGSSPEELAQTAYGDLMSRGILTNAPRISMAEYDQDYSNRWNAYNQQFGPNGELPMMDQTGAEGVTYVGPGTPTAPDLTYSGWSNAFYTPASPVVADTGNQGQ